MNLIFLYSRRLSIIYPTLLSFRMWAILQNDTTDEYIVATGRTCTLRDFTAAVFNCCGLDWQEYVHQDAALIWPSDIVVSSANPKKLPMFWAVKRNM